nr:ferritin-like protein [uncultured Chitinophaga sp.]
MEANPLISGVRHRLTRSGAPTLTEFNSINTIEGLRKHLQVAIELEHSTIPPYLYALYSIRNRTNDASSRVIKGVVMEEMLHMILACNILNAVGGKPDISSPSFIPEYPTYLPHSNKAFEVNLEKFSRQAIDTFLKIEKPGGKDAPPQPDHYASIGQFYEAIVDGLKRLSAEGNIFTGKRSRQIRPEQFYGGGGGLIEVYDLATAEEAISEIVGQGEGIDDTIEDSNHQLFGEEVEYAHYFRFNEIYKEQYYKPTDTPKGGPTGEKFPVDWTMVQNVKENIKMKDFKKGTEEWDMMYQFNKRYCDMLKMLHRTANGEREKLEEAVLMMYELKYLAQGLMNVPMGNGLYAGPSFEYVT